MRDALDTAVEGWRVAQARLKARLYNQAGVHNRLLIRTHASQSNERPTAFFQPAYNFSRVAASIDGRNSRSSAQFFLTSSRPSQYPTARPARYAAPSAVVSATTGRRTETFNKSDWNCSSIAFAAAPPSTFSVVSGR